MSKQQKINPEPLQAIDFEAPGKSSLNRQNLPTNESTNIKKESPWWYSQFNLMLSAFALLVVVSIVFILVVPEPDVKQIATDNNSLDSVSVNGEQAPWDKTQKSQARTKSQAILSKLLNIKQELESKKVTLWAAERYQEALDKAQYGDEFYKQQKYQEAISSYNLALTKMQTLAELLPNIINNKLSEGEQAIDQGKSQLAQKVFSDILQYAEKNERAQKGLKRANKLEEALVYLKSASQHAQNFQQNDQLDDLYAAEEQYKQALVIDEQLKQANEGLQQVQKTIVDKRFKISMSKGYAAMTISNFSAAKDAFSQALKIKPNEKMAASSYQQALTADQSSSLAQLISDAKKFEENENWQNALSTYQFILQKDSNQVDAKLGLLRTNVRNTLNLGLLELLSDKLSLSKASIRKKAERLLGEAVGIKRKGPKLKKQIGQVQTALKEIQIPIKVQLISNEVTNVDLLKIGSTKIQLGQFSQKNLSLKPGRYVATGARIGFRDVRVELELYPTSSIQSFVIQSDESIADGK